MLMMDFQSKDQIYEDTAVCKGGGRCFVGITNLNVIDGLKDDFFKAILVLCLNLFNETQFAKGKGSSTFES